MTDVLLRQINDGGEITYINGNPETTNGLEVAAYLSLMGGNKNDSGTSSDDPFQWWGNFDEVEPEKQYRSEFQNLIQGLSNVAANLLRIEEAAGRDLKWMVDTGIALLVEVSATVPGVNLLKVEILIVVSESESVRFTFITAVTT